jgi:glycerophosphoryl diester phosphodiesterase
MTITFAHRGARLEEPENTIAAFTRALAAGVSGIETDVWLAADGEVVCSHDAVVRSGRRRRRISETTAAELA